jgi:hypothetical protein
MEFMKTLTEAMDPVKMIEQAEKNVATMLNYVQPKELCWALTKLSEANSAYAKASVTAVKSMAEIAKDSTTKFTNNLANLAKTVKSTK